MSDYTKSTNFTAKDALPTGDTNKIIRGADFDGEFNNLVTAVATKTDKIVPSAAGNVATLDVNGNLTDSEKAGPTGVFVGTTDTQTLTNKTFTGYTETVFAITGTTPTISAANGTIQTWTLSANSTPVSGLSSGQSVVLHIDDGTAYDITWTGLVDEWKTGGGLKPTLNTTIDTVVVIWKVGTTVFGAKVGDN
jgi:hypothetical protein